MKEETLKLNKNDIVLVKWKDASSISEWLSEKECEEFFLIKCVSVGFFFSQDKKYLKLSLTVIEDGDRDISVISQKNIYKIEKLN